MQFYYIIKIIKLDKSDKETIEKSIKKSLINIKI